MALTSVSVYELSRLASYPQQTATTVRRRSNSTKVRHKDADFGTVERRRRSQNQNHDPITITYLGRPRSPSVDLPTSPPIPTVLRQRRPSPAIIKKVPSASSIATSPTKKGPGKKPQKPSQPIYASQPIPPASLSKPSLSTSGLWSECIEAVNEIGVMAKIENKKIRRLRMAVSRRIKVDGDEELVLTATRILSRCHGWTLDTCHDYLPIIIDNIASVDDKSRSIALEGLAAIADGFSDRLVKFAGVSTHRIGVDIAAEERSEKANTCIQLLRSVVKKRDWYYRQLDEKSIDKLDAAMERLKKI